MDYGLHKPKKTKSREQLRRKVVDSKWWEINMTSLHRTSTCGVEKSCQFQFAGDEKDGNFETM